MHYFRCLAIICRNSVKMRNVNLTQNYIYGTNKSRSQGYFKLSTANPFVRLWHCIYFILQNPGYKIELT